MSIVKVQQSARKKNNLPGKESCVAPPDKKAMINYNKKYCGVVSGMAGSFMPEAGKGRYHDRFISSGPDKIL